MERKFKAVAMRFTQEAFEKMDKTGMEIWDISRFDKHPYLVNNYSGNKLRVTNFKKQASNCRGRTVIETCDPKLFRQYCGLENSVEEDLKDEKRPFEKELNTVIPYLFSSCLISACEQKEIHDELKDAISKNKRGFYFLFLDPVEEEKEKRIKRQSIRELYSELQDRLPRIEDEAITGETTEKEVIIPRKNVYTDMPSGMESRPNSNDNFSFVVPDSHNDVYIKGCFSKHEKPKSRVENEPKTFQSKDLQYFHEGHQKWVDFRLLNPNIKLRFKPNPTKTLDTEIEALNQKAKEMGFKAVITFESL